MENWKIIVGGLLILGLLYFTFGSRTVSKLRNYYKVAAVIGFGIIVWYFFVKGDEEEKEDALMIYED